MNKEEIKQFSDGIRMIMLVQRNKEGGKSDEPQKHAHKKITKNSEEFFEIFEEFKGIKESSEKPLRIYSSLNKRDINKAIREFKQRQLDNDYADQTTNEMFYHDIKNRWISCLMKPACRAETLFIIDGDDLTKKTIGKAIDEIDKITDVVWHYKTKNGYHIITKPFNPALYNNKFGEINKDGLLLLDY